MKKRKFSVFFKKYINGTKGVISLFLALLMVPFASIAAALINAGRINSAVAIFDEALCNASNSTLGTYDSFLRNRFGLMAMEQNTASGGTEYGNTSATYTAENLINDIFTYYMNQNLSCLSNTYSATELSAIGVYPLSDTSVLLSSINQAGKISVPAKLITDWASIDDMVSKLTKGLSVASSIADTTSSVSNLGSDISDLEKKSDKLQEKIDACTEKITEYENKYSSFINAVAAFNTLIDNITSAELAVAQWQAEVDRLNAQRSTVNTDNDEAAPEPTEEQQSIEDEYTTACENLQNAQNTLNNYKNDFPAKRSEVESAKTDYYNSIVNLRDEIDATCTAAVAFQNKGKSVINDGASLLSNGISTTLNIAKSVNEKQIEELKEQNEEYEYQEKLAGFEDGYSEYETNYYNMIQENNSTINELNNNNVNLGNADKLQKDAKEGLSATTNSLSEFISTDLQSQYKAIYDELDTLRLNVNSKIDIPKEYTQIQDYTYFVAVANPVERATIEGIIDGLTESIINSAGWAVLKGVVSFIKALMTIDFFYDGNLTAQINTGYYSENGGLPSQRTGHSIENPYEKEDAELSAYYKELLNSYSVDDVYTDVLDATSIVEEIISYINTLVKLTSDFDIWHLPDLISTAVSMFNLIRNSITNMILDAAFDKALVVGYVSYYTANRTTYDGKSLTGTKYNLPNTDENTGYTFSGAETEYIFNGSLSEIKNQESVFYWLFIMRTFLNLIGPVPSNTTIQAWGTALDTVTLGAGHIILIILFSLADGFVDSVVLANGGTIPMVKTFVYLTPAGIPKLVEGLWSLKLKESFKKTVYEDAISCASKIDSDITYPSYDEYSAAQKTADNNKYNVFTWDYTKSLQVLLMIGKSENTIVSRLADIIQMEASYNAATSNAATYNFNLDKSYTYLRASGSFTSNVFIKIGDSDELSSQKRVIYKGY